MTREETIDKITKGLGGRSIFKENHNIDLDEIRRIILNILTFQCSIHLHAEVLEDEIKSVETAKWFCRHTKEGAVMVGSLTIDLAVAILGEKDANELLDEAGKLTETIHSVAFAAIKNGVNESDLN